MSHIAPCQLHPFGLSGGAGGEYHIHWVRIQYSPHGLLQGGGIPWGPVLASLLLGNIPTVILLAIYAACREKRRKRGELDKMQIKDL